MKKIEIKSKFAQTAHVNHDQYLKLYEKSVKDPESFWRDQAERISWFKKPTKIKNTQYHSPVSIKWYEDGELNVSYNCIDRHLARFGAKTPRDNKVALIFEPDNPQTPVQKITYAQLYDHVNRLANVLKKIGVKKGDVVTIYMPMIPEAVYSMLACARIGAIHSVVFGGFAPDSIIDRIVDCDSHFVITADEGLRGGKSIPLKKNIDDALAKIEQKNLQPNSQKKVLLFKHTGGAVHFENRRDVWAHEELPTVESECAPEKMNAEDPLFILYTSGSTNKPKGVLHTTGGYLVYVSMTHELVFDLKENDIYWCTADVGWVTGHSYIVYGPLANGATSLVFEGVPHYPDFSRFWQVIDKHQVSIFYTAPTAIRALMREGEGPVKSSSRKSLRLLGSVGEPINPEAWLWYYKVVGEERCPIVDTWWQTETGGILISPLPGATDLKPGSATLPLFGVRPKLLTPEGAVIEPKHGESQEGVLVLEDSWPGQMRTVYRDHKRFEETYFSTYKGYYFTGDGCRRDEDGYYWITGRVDDVLNVSGHRLGTAEIESALVAHPAVAEAAVVGYPHDIKGQGIYAFVILKSGIESSEALRKELVQFVRSEISAIATPDLLQFTPGLPKTRSGKIMRRILRKIAENQPEALGDTSTLADPSVVAHLVNERLNK